MSHRLLTLLLTFCLSLSLALLAPAQPAPAPPQEQYPDGVILKREMPKDWILRLNFRITPSYPFDDPREQLTYDLKNSPVFVPIIPESGFSKNDLDFLKAWLSLDDRKLDKPFELLPPGPLSARLVKFNIPEYKGRDINMHVEQTIATWNAILDEKTALSIPWPEKWPAEALSALQPQFYIDFKNPAIAPLVARALGPDPKALSPYASAKTIAKFVVDNFKRNGTDSHNNRHGLFDGFNVQGADKVALTMTGSRHDAVTLFVALCRSAGIPARPIIGLDSREKQDGGEKDKNARFVPWAEVFVPKAGWVVFDFRPLWDGPGVMKDGMRPWPGVGTNNDLNEMLPVSFLYKPQLGVLGASADAPPMFWGWQPAPSQTNSDQHMTFEFLRTASNPQRRGE